MADNIPRVGGIIEDETGWWQIVEIDLDEGGAWLMDKHGEERFRLFRNLGPVKYDP